jgi:hypothetical protein
VESLDVEKLVGELEVAVDRLRSLYDQYFMGIEKLEPTVPRKDVERRIQVLRKEQIRNTAQRFRFQMLLQRYNTYQTHWLRICREIENGTYKRHVVRAQERFGVGRAGRRASVPPLAQLGARQPTAALEAELAELDKEFAPARGDGPADFDIEVELEPEPPPRAPGVPPPLPRAGSKPGPVWRPVPTSPDRSSPPGSSSASPPVPAPSSPVTAPRAAPPFAAAAPQRPSLSAPPAPRAASQLPRPPPIAAPKQVAPPAGSNRTPGDLPDERVREIYARYVEAKRRQNESTATITYEAVAKSLRESSAKLREKHGKAVDFEVAVKDGKAILKPVLK